MTAKAFDMKDLEIRFKRRRIVGFSAHEKIEILKDSRLKRVTLHLQFCSESVPDLNRHVGGAGLMEITYKDPLFKALNSQGWLVLEEYEVIIDAGFPVVRYSFVREG